MIGGLVYGSTHSMYGVTSFFSQFKNHDNNYKYVYRIYFYSHLSFFQTNSDSDFKNSSIVPNSSTQFNTTEIIATTSISSFSNESIPVVSESSSGLDFYLTVYVSSMGIIIVMMIAKGFIGATVCIMMFLYRSHQLQIFTSKWSAKLLTWIKNCLLKNLY